MNSFFNILAYNKKNVISNQGKSSEFAGACFSDNHNLGVLGDKPIATLAEARLQWAYLSYSTNVYTNIQQTKIVLSYNEEYNPVLTGRIAKQELEDRDIYRFILPTNKGEIRTQTVLKVLYKCETEAVRERRVFNSPFKKGYVAFCDAFGENHCSKTIFVKSGRHSRIFQKHRGLLNEYSRVETSTATTDLFKYLDKTIASKIKEIEPKVQYVRTLDKCYEDANGVKHGLRVSMRNEIPFKVTFLETSVPSNYEKHQILPLNYLDNLQEVECFCVD